MTKQKTCIEFYHYNPPHEKTYKEIFSEKLKGDQLQTGDA